MAKFIWWYTYLNYSVFTKLSPSRNSFLTFKFDAYYAIGGPQTSFESWNFVHICEFLNTFKYLYYWRLECIFSPRCEHRMFALAMWCLLEMGMHSSGEGDMQPRDLPLMSLSDFFPWLVIPVPVYRLLTSISSGSKWCQSSWHKKRALWELVG